MACLTGHFISYSRNAFPLITVNKMETRAKHFFLLLLTCTNLALVSSYITVENIVTNIRQPCFNRSYKLERPDGSLKLETNRNVPIFHFRSGHSCLTRNVPNDVYSNVVCTGLITVANIFLTFLWSLPTAEGKKFLSVTVLENIFVGNIILTNRVNSANKIDGNKRFQQRYLCMNWV